MKVLKIHTASLGIVALGIALGAGIMLVKQNGWVEVPARIQSVTMTCIMHPMHAGVGERSPEIGCADVEAFRRQHAGREWIVNERFAATVRVPSGATFVGAPIELQRVDGVAPQPNSILSVLQNPADATQVAAAGRSGLALAVAAGGAVVGLLLLLAAFWRPKPSRRDMELALDRASIRIQVATAAAEAAKAGRAVLGDRQTNRPVFGKR